MTTQDKVNSMALNEVVLQLMEKDPKLEQHLKKLLCMAIDKPKTFEAIISMLKFY